MSLVVNHNLMANSVARNLNSHYSKLQTSVQRLSTGLRVNGASDDAAGLAIRELQRVDIAALHQGVRNANDAISLIETADGALGVIDEKLIRMKELAEQAATGTYDSTQRLMIESEYQAMASEITRIANATDFNGMKLLDGTLSGVHDGSGLVSTGKMKIHFGTGNDSAEDYYYIQIGSCTAKGLGVGNSAVSNLKTVYLSPDGKELQATKGWLTLDGSLYTPKLRDVHIQPVYTDGTIDTTAGDGTLLTISEHVTTGDQPAGTYFSTEYGWNYTPVGTLTQYNVKYDGREVAAYFDQGSTIGSDFIIFDTVYADEDGNIYGPKDVVAELVEGGPAVYADAYTVSTQEAAQRALVGINAAIVSKDKIRAQLGAMQNRLENTVSNLSIEAENLLASESRISDVDVATEMTKFVRNQILTQSAVAMLGQANSLSKMAMQLIGG